MIQKDNLDLFLPSRDSLQRKFPTCCSPCQPQLIASHLLVCVHTLPSLFLTYLTAFSLNTYLLFSLLGFWFVFFFLLLSLNILSKTEIWFIAQGQTSHYLGNYFLLNAFFKATYSNWIQISPPTQF